MPPSMNFHSTLQSYLPSLSGCVCRREGKPPPESGMLMITDERPLVERLSSSSPVVAGRQAATFVSRQLTGLADGLARLGKLSSPISEETTDREDLLTMPLSVVVFGASGDLARKKLFPAIYQLCVLGHLPRDLNLIAVGRKHDLDFGSRITLHAGSYDAPDAFAALASLMEAHENGEVGNRLFMLAVPPSVFGSIAELLATYCRAPEPGFTRLLIEKPFGRDSASFAALHALTSRHFAEHQLFRVDHYLAKEVVLNIATLRWGNQLFEPTWSNRYIESVQVTFKEDLGTGGRGGFFDREGIIRDCVQNHLMQAFMWLAMEPPASMSAADIVRSKCELLRCVPALHLDHESTFLGQFAACDDEAGYLDDPSVPRYSRCPTFASTIVRVNNDRWRGVPFLFVAAKGMDERVCELRVRYKPHSLNRMFVGSSVEEARNELVMRVQPDEALYMLTVAKEPGLTTGEQVNRAALPPYHTSTSPPHLASRRLLTSVLASRLSPLAETGAQAGGDGHELRAAVCRRVRRRRLRACHPRCGARRTVSVRIFG
jgi:glucose-6-phosphate 1-dehydrogenase